VPLWRGSRVTAAQHGVLCKARGALLLFNERIYHVDPACHRESAREAECQLSTPSTTVN